MMLCVSLMVQAQTTWTYGDHTYTMNGNLTAEKYNSGATGVVTFTNVPSDYEEFEALYTQFLGKTPHGPAAMMPMAMEIYGRNREEGLRCLQLINWHLSYTLIGQHKHRVARENGLVGVPLLVYRHLSTTYIGIVHKVVVKEGVVMIGLQTNSRHKDVLWLFAP